MSSWQTLKLGEIVSIKTGKIDANKAVENGTYPFFTCAKEISRIDDAPYEGKVVLVAGNGDLNVKYYEGKFNAYQRTYFLTSLDEKSALPKYIYFFMEHYLQFLRTQSIGTTVKYIKMENLSDAIIPLPTIEEQHKIVELLEGHLSRLDAALADVKQAKLKAAQFRRAFIHEMTTSVEGSEVMSILEICDVYQPKTISTKELIPDGEFAVYGANGQIGFYDKFNHEESEVTVTCRGATCGTVNVIPAMSWITGNAMVFSPKDSRIQKGYLEYVLRGMDWTPVITGTAQPQITRTSIKDVFINLPSPEIQHEIYMKLESVLTQVTNASILSETIESQGASLRRSLLNAAFTGKLTKEVASV